MHNQLWFLYKGNPWPSKTEKEESELVGQTKERSRNENQTTLYFLEQSLYPIMVL